jgi:phage FluMu protein Com
MTLALPHMETPSTERAEETDHDERQDDPTPRGIVRAVLWAAAREGTFDGGGKRGWDELRVLDVCAGYGAWSSEMRRLAQLQGWPVHITGVELYEARRDHLAKWCDEVWIRDWFDALRDHHELPEFDIIIGNPHFQALTGRLTPGDMFGEHTPSMPETELEHAPAVLLLHTQQAFLKSEAGRAAWRRCPPAASWLVPGSVKFRNGINPKCPKCKTVNPPALDEGACPVTYCVKGCGAKLKAWGADSRCYQVTLWLRGHAGPCSVHLLDDLDARARSWRVPPGSEEPSAELPAAPGWTS